MQRKCGLNRQFPRFANISKADISPIWNYSDPTSLHVVDGRITRNRETLGGAYEFPRLRARMAPWRQIAPPVGAEIRPDGTKTPINGAPLPAR